MHGTLQNRGFGAKAALRLPRLPETRPCVRPVLRLVCYAGLKNSNTDSARYLDTRHCGREWPLLSHVDPLPLALPSWQPHPLVLASVPLRRDVSNACEELCVPPRFPQQQRLASRSAGLGSGMLVTSQCVRPQPVRGALAPHCHLLPNLSCSAQPPSDRHQRLLQARCRVGPPGASRR